MDIVLIVLIIAIAIMYIAEKVSDIFEAKYKGKERNEDNQNEKHKI